jgi:hypothetical protein
VNIDALVRAKTCKDNIMHGIGGTPIAEGGASTPIGMPAPSSPDVVGAMCPSGAPAGSSSACAREESASGSGGAAASSSGLVRPLDVDVDDTEDTQGPRAKRSRLASFVPGHVGHDLSENDQAVAIIGSILNSIRCIINTTYSITNDTFERSLYQWGLSECRGAYFEI